MIVYVIFELGLRAAAKRALQEGSNLSEFLISVVVNAQLVQDCWVELVLVQSCEKVCTCLLVLLHGEIALS